MTLNSLHFWRKALPFIAVACIIPLLVHSGGLDSIPLRYTLAASALALAVPFFYITLKMREASWNREMEGYVRSQIRDSLITLIPEDLKVTAEEREQLKHAEIYKHLSGVFWDTINQDELLRAQKEHFYSNGLEYSTAIDVFLLLRFFGAGYVGLSLLLGDSLLFLCGAGFVAIALGAKWFAIPRVRQRHLQLSIEQLDLLRRQKGEYVSTRFREIVLEWRGNASPCFPRTAFASASGALRRLGWNFGWFRSVRGCCRYHHARLVWCRCSRKSQACSGVIVCQSQLAY